MKTLYFCFWFKNRDKENCNSWQSFSRIYHICYEWPILLRRFLSFHCALNCSLGCFSIPKCAAFGLKGWNLTQNSSVQQMQHKFQLRLLSRYPDFCTHTLHYTVCQFIIIEALLSPFEGKGLWGQTWPPKILCPFSRYMSVRLVQCSADPESDLQICIVVTWF